MSKLEKEPFTGVKRVREVEGHVHSSGLYEAVERSTNLPVVICAYCSRWWDMTGLVKKVGNGTCKDKENPT